MHRKEEHRMCYNKVFFIFICRPVLRGGRLCDLVCDAGIGCQEVQAVPEEPVQTVGAAVSSKNIKVLLSHAADFAGASPTC